MGNHMVADDFLVDDLNKKKEIAKPIEIATMSNRSNVPFKNEPWATSDANITKTPKIKYMLRTVRELFLELSMRKFVKLNDQSASGKLKTNQDQFLPRS